MDQLLNPLLTLILQHGYPILVGAIVVTYLGVPFSLNTVLLAAGAFAADDTLRLYILIPLAAGTAVCGDLFQYTVGRRFGDSFISLALKRMGRKPREVYSAGAFVTNWGAWSIFLSRWLLTPLGPLVNLIVGSRKYPIKRFLFVAGLGECLWAGIYCGLGYVFGANWLAIADYANDVPFLLMMLVIGLGSLLVFRRMHRDRSV